MKKENTNIKYVKLEKVFIIAELIGDGTPNKPLEIVHHYYDEDGNLLFTK